MPLDQNDTELSVGGPSGVRIRGSGFRDGLSDLGSSEQSSLRELSSALVLVRSHPVAVAASLALAGVVMLVGSAVLISGLGLPWLLYTGPVVISVVAFGLAVVVAAGVRKVPLVAGVDLQHRILDLAVHSGGQLTVGATAHALRISLADAEETLMGLARANHVDIENDVQTGAVIYVFRDFRGQIGPTRGS